VRHPLCALLCAGWALAQQPAIGLPTLIHVVEIRKLSMEQASLKYPVRLQGVVTYFDPSSFSMFIQDATGGIWVRHPQNSARLEAGQQIELQGITRKGFAPGIDGTQFHPEADKPGVMNWIERPEHKVAVQDAYGAKPGEASFANNCLLARRLVEKGVRFVQLYHEAWDQHSNLVKDLQKNCLNTDRAAAALIKDLKRRGLLDETLVVWGGEFGRTPMVQGGSDGRDHHPNAFTMWMAGGGIKTGISVGETDELGAAAVKDRFHVKNLHATILHQLGIHPDKLTYFHSGLEQKLVGVEGAQPITQLL